VSSRLDIISNGGRVQRDREAEKELSETKKMSKKDFQIGIVIATAFQRTDLLLDRSLRSALNQTYSPDFIVVVDDNRNENEFEIITERITQLNNPGVFCIRNFKTKHNSGTGAWNSGVDFLCGKFEDLRNSYIAILDDDDEWNRAYLEKCSNQIKTRGFENTKGIFTNLIRFHTNFEVKLQLDKDNLTVKNFLVGNPGVQSSNMFFNLQSFLGIGGFDENLQSCTDRDLMIRFLQENSTDQIAFVNEILVYHYAQKENTVTNNPTSKWAGLDRFYKKYLNSFDAKMLEKSLRRAEKYFFYPNREQILKSFTNLKKIVLAMPLHNGMKTIRRAVLSVVNQKNVQRKLILVIGNDNSTDNWQQEIKDLITDNIVIINVANAGKSFKVRNAINDYILKNIKNVAYIGRLDADDELADDFVICKLEEIIDKQNPDVIFAGNYQRRENKIVGVNMPTKEFLDHSYLKERLYKMSMGNFDAELPSCNTFLKPERIINYPAKESAEDHWLTVELLLNSNKCKIHIANDFVYSIYSFSGNLTNMNKEKEKYIQSRKDLYEYFKGKINEKTE
jgi:glycosyltransferase involved in cell wall biosynthesis